MNTSKFLSLPFVPNRHRIKVVLSCVRERLRGLDFSMPDRMYDRGRNDGAMYLASSDTILRELLSCVDMEKFHGLFDVGCGKGHVLWKAWQWGFSQVGGVEYDERMYQICMRNLRRLKLQNKIRVACGDACDFQDYGSYDVFYFYNPFMEETMQRVMGRIMEQCRGKEVVIIYYRPRYTSAIERSGCFQCIARRYDKDKGYEAYVYQGVIPQ